MIRIRREREVSRLMKEDLFPSFSSQVMQNVMSKVGFSENLFSYLSSTSTTALEMREDGGRCVYLENQVEEERGGNSGEQVTLVMREDERFLTGQPVVFFLSWEMMMMQDVLGKKENPVICRHSCGSFKWFAVSLTVCHRLGNCECQRTTKNSTSTTIVVFALLDDDYDLSKIVFRGVAVTKQHCQLTGVSYFSLHTSWTLLHLSMVNGQQTHPCCGK